MIEKLLQARIIRVFNRGPIRLWRNNSGQVQSSDGRWHHFGLCKGSADLIGMKQIQITPDMVGRKLAVFLSVEVKSPTGKLTDEQKAWREFVESFGGVACVVRSEKEAEKMFHGPVKAAEPYSETPVE